MAIRIFVVVLFGPLIVSGCIDNQVEPLAIQHSKDLTPDPGYGSLSGFVVTDGLDPIPGANVKIFDGPGMILQLETDNNGTFEVRNLEPGNLFVQVSANCCRDSIERLAVDREEILNFMFHLDRLTKDELQIEYVETMEWTGFLACTVRWVEVYRPLSGVNICGGVDGVSGQAGHENITDDDFMVNWTVRPGLKSIVGGMTWQNPAMAMGDELEISLEPDHVKMPVYARASGSSPLEWRVDEGDILATYSEEFEEFDFSNFTEETQLRYRVFAAGDLNVVYQQKFTVYWDLYYWAPAPPAATVLPDS